MTTVAAIACSAMLMTSAATTAQTVADRTTFVTFSGPVSIPGATLPAGTYTFKLADSPANRNIVQVFDKDGMKLFATLLAVAADRTEAAGDPVVTFKETAANRPPAVRYWYYAGERSGSEFIYPKSQAIEIARASGDSVMSVDTDSTSIDDWKKATPSRVTADAAQSSTATSSSTSTSSASTSTSSTTSASSTTTAAPAMQPMATAPAQPATTTPEPTSAPAPTTAPAAASTPAQTATAPTPATPRAQPPTAADQTAGTSGRAEPKKLPRTASELPTVGLIGVLALAGALMLRARRVNA